MAAKAVRPHGATQVSPESAVRNVEYTSLGPIENLNKGSEKDSLKLKQMWERPAIVFGGVATARVLVNQKMNEQAWGTDTVVRREASMLTIANIAMIHRTKPARLQCSYLGEGVYGKPILAIGDKSLAS